MSNIFETLHILRGDLSEAQERALIGFVANLGRAKFGEYRRAAGVGETPIPRLSKGEAHRLINLVVSDLEAAR